MPPPATEPPVTLDLWLDREVLQPAATATLTVTVYNQSYARAPDLTLTLNLPAGLATTDGQTGALPLECRCWRRVRPISTLQMGLYTFIKQFFTRWEYLMTASVLTTLP